MATDALSPSLAPSPSPLRLLSDASSPLSLWVRSSALALDFLSSWEEEEEEDKEEEEEEEEEEDVLAPHPPLPLPVTLPPTPPEHRIHSGERMKDFSLAIPT